MPSTRVPYIPPTVSKASGTMPPPNATKSKTNPSTRPGPSNIGTDDKKVRPPIIVAPKPVYQPANRVQAVPDPIQRIQTADLLNDGDDALFAAIDLGITAEVIVEEEEFGAGEDSAFLDGEFMQEK